MAVASELIEISEVDHASTDALAGAEINAPAPGDRLGTYAIEVRGWAVGRDDAVASVELASEGSALRAVPLDVERPHVAERLEVAPSASIGFRALVNALALPAEFELDVAALTKTGERIRIAVVRGKRKELPVRADPPLQPLIVTTLGRTGSMLLLRLLEAHPEVLVLRPHRYEQRVAGYWTEVLLALTDPVSYTRQLAPAGSLDRQRWWLGDEGPTPGFDPQSPLQKWLATDAVEAIGEICRGRIDALYAEAASAQSGVEPRYFAEKHTLQSAALTTELYPRAREVFLVRDFRDMVTSILAFNRKRGVQGFGEGAADGAVDYVDRLGGWADGLVRRYARRRDDAHVVRYEDLVREPRATLEALLEYLEADMSDEVMARMLGTLETEMPELAEHATSPGPPASVGRWRSDLDQDLKLACERAFGGALEAFGYEPSA